MHLITVSEDVFDKMAAEIDSLELKVENLEAEEERSFSVLEMYGIPKDRAKSVNNGIQVFDTRMQRELNAMVNAAAKLQDLVNSLKQEKTELESGNNRLLIMILRHTCGVRDCMGLGKVESATQFQCDWCYDRTELVSHPPQTEGKEV